MPVELQQTAQELGDAPRLRDAAARRVRLLRVEHLADRADARRRSGGRSRPSRARRALRDVVRDERAAARRCTARSASSTRCPGGTRHRASADRRGSCACSRDVTRESERRPTGVSSSRSTVVDDRGPVRGREHRMRQRDREQLVRAARRIVAALAVDDVVRGGCLAGSRTAVERSVRAIRVLGDARAASLVAASSRAQPLHQARARCTRAR